ncbi:hypothetical protein ACTXT7_007567 [Hymenolepis weldensis]
MKLGVFNNNDVSVELPFTLAHPKPPPEEAEEGNPANGNAISPSADSTTDRPGTTIVAAPTTTTTAAVVVTESPSPTASQTAATSGGGGVNECITSVLASSDGAAGDFINLVDPFTGKQPMTLPNDDLIFEDFARLRLRGQDSNAGAATTATEETTSPSSAVPTVTSENPFPPSSSITISPTASQ